MVELIGQFVQFVVFGVWQMLGQVVFVVGDVVQYVGDVEDWLGYVVGVQLQYQQVEYCGVEVEVQFDLGVFVMYVVQLLFQCQGWVEQGVFWYFEEYVLGFGVGNWL